MNLGCIYFSLMLGCLHAHSRLPVDMISTVFLNDLEHLFGLLGHNFDRLTCGGRAGYMVGNEAAYRGMKADTPFMMVTSIGTLVFKLSVCMSSGGTA
jgi:hypothetical protein